jgi:putative transposase
LEHNVPEGLAVFSPPEADWRRKRAANPIERAIQQELKRRAKKVRLRRAALPLEGPLILLSPNEAALERLSTATLVEIDEEWIAKDRAYVTMDNRDG